MPDSFNNSKNKLWGYSLSSCWWSENLFDSCAQLPNPTPKGAWVIKLTDLSSVFELFIFSDVLDSNREILILNNGNQKFGSYLTP